MGTQSSLTSSENPIAARASQIRQMLCDLQNKPVTGSQRWLKRLIYQPVRSAFRRQFAINTATLELVEMLDRELQASRLLSGKTASTSAGTKWANSLSLSEGETVGSGDNAQNYAQPNDIRTLHGFDAVYSSSANMRMTERVTLYSLIFGLQPKNCLKIGAARDGSSAIICGALDDTGFGQLSCVDPQPRVDPELWGKICNRCRLFEGPSPEILSEVVQQVNAQFDFVLIDAHHAYEAVRRDIRGVLPYLAKIAHVLFHDALDPDVSRAISETVAADDQLVDCGLMSVEMNVQSENGQNTTGAGLRLLKYQRRPGRIMAA